MKKGDASLIAYSFINQAWSDEMFETTRLMRSFVSTQAKQN